MVAAGFPGTAACEGLMPAGGVAGAMADPRLRFEQLARPETGCLAYVIADGTAREALVVDAPSDIAPALEAARRLGVRIAKVAETHTHADHRSGARALAAATGAELWMPQRSAARFPHQALADNADLRVGDLRLRAVHTPGHTPDAMSLLLPDRAIVGDTLLVGTAGRADFYARGPEELYHSIFDKLLKLSDEVQVYPAHYGPRHGLPEELMTTVGRERRLNEAVNQRTKEDFIKYMTEGWPPKPKDWEAIVAANNAG